MATLHTPSYRRIFFTVSTEWVDSMFRLHTGREDRMERQCSNNFSVVLPWAVFDGTGDLFTATFNYLLDTLTAARVQTWENLGELGGVIVDVAAWAFHTVQELLAWSHQTTRHVSHVLGTGVESGS